MILPRTPSNSHWLRLAIIAAWLFSLLAYANPSAAHPAVEPSFATSFFIQNAGQFDPAVQFTMDGNSTRLWLAQDGLWLSLFSHGTSQLSAQPGAFQLTGINLRLQFLGADPHAQLQPVGRFATRMNYLGAKNPLSASTWSSVVYHNLYPGIDLVISPPAPGSADIFSWRLETSTQADLGQVHLAVSSADTLELRQDHLLLGTTTGELSLPLIQVPSIEKPRLTSVVPHISSLGGGQFIVSNPLLHSKAYNSKNLLVPAGLAYSTYLGGSAWDEGNAVAVGQDGSIYVAGRTASPNFPTTAGVFDQTGAQVDGFVARLASTGDHLIYATFLGGSGADAINSLALLGDQAYISGDTQSRDFPTTSAALDTTCGSDGTCNTGDQGPLHDAFLALLSADGSQLEYSTFLGGSDEDRAYGVAVDGQQVFLTGITYSTDFPASGYKSNGDAFIVSINAAHQLDYARLLGGSDVDAGFAITARGGEAYLTGETSSLIFLNQSSSGGRDVFLAHLSASGNLVNLTLVGGFGDERGSAIALSPSGNIGITGWTTSPDLPVTSGTYSGNGDAFILLADSQASVSKLVYLGGSAMDDGRGIIYTASGSLWLTGYTNSNDFPVTAQAFQSAPGGAGDAFITQVDLSAAQASQLIYSTYLGGNKQDYSQALAHSQAGITYLTGFTQSTNFPLTSPNLSSALKGQQDVFISSLAASTAPQPTQTSPTQTSAQPLPSPTSSQGSPLEPTVTSLVIQNTATVLAITAQPSLGTSSPAGTATVITATPRPSGVVNPTHLAQITQGSINVPTTIVENTTSQPEPTLTPASSATNGQKGSSLWWIIPIVVVVGGLAGWFIYRQRRG